MSNKRFFILLIFSIGLAFLSGCYNDELVGKTLKIYVYDKELVEDTKVSIIVPDGKKDLLVQDAVAYYTLDPQIDFARVFGYLLYDDKYEIKVDSLTSYDNIVISPYNDLYFSLFGTNIPKLSKKVRLLHGLFSLIIGKNYPDAFFDVLQNSYYVQALSSLVTSFEVPFKVIKDIEKYATLEDFYIPEFVADDKKSFVKKLDEIKFLDHFASFSVNFITVVPSTTVNITQSSATVLLDFGNSTEEVYPDLFLNFPTDTIYYGKLKIKIDYPQKNVWLNSCYVGSYLKDDQGNVLSVPVVAKTVKFSVVDNVYQFLDVEDALIATGEAIYIPLDTIARWAGITSKTYPIYIYIWFEDEDGNLTPATFENETKITIEKKVSL